LKRPISVTNIIYLFYHPVWSHSLSPYYSNILIFSLSYSSPSSIQKQSNVLYHQYSNFLFLYPFSHSYLIFLTISFNCNHNFLWIWSNSPYISFYKFQNFLLLHSFLYNDSYSSIFQTLTLKLTRYVILTCFPAASKTKIIFHTYSTTCHFQLIDTSPYFLRR